MINPRLGLAGILALVPLLSQQGGGDTADLLSSLDGRWAGTLTYVDYSSEREVELPMRVRCEAGEDGNYLLQVQELVDPGRLVRSLEVLVPGPEPDRVRTVGIDGAEIDESEYTIESREVRSRTSWTLVCLAEGRDDGRAAAKRVTQTLEGDVLNVVTEYRPLDESGSPWKRRNSVRLERVRSLPADLAGTWLVDLRPTPDADEYYKDMILELEGAQLSGTFHDTPIANAGINDDWGDVRFAFTTGDGTGAYNTTGVLRGDRIEDTTHSVGRGFLSVRTAVRKP